MRSVRTWNPRLCGLAVTGLLLVLVCWPGLGARLHLDFLARYLPTAANCRQAPSVWCRFSDQSLLGHPVPSWLYVPLLLLALGFVVVRQMARHSVSGPIRVGEVIDATSRATDAAEARDGLGAAVAPTSGGAGEPAPPRAPEAATSRALDVRAILLDRLAQDGIQPRGVVPSYQHLDPGEEQTVASSPLAVSGLLTKLGLDYWGGSVRRLGWRVSATLRSGALPGRVGLTFVVEHVATGRHDLTQTVWAVDEREAARMAAYTIAAWYQQRQARASSRRQPRWRPTAQSLRHYQDAMYHARQRRFDEAQDAARLGLAEDPANLALRRVLAETHERMGHFVSALDAYASGIVMLLDVDNGWSPRVHPWSARSGLYPTWPAPLWRLARRPGADRHPRLLRRISTVEAVGLVWRYVIVLTFSNQWVDRWLIDLLRSEMVRRRADGVPRAERWGAKTGVGVLEREDPDAAPPWPTEEHARARDRLREVSSVLCEQEKVEREEQSKRLRGFFARRYSRILAEEFPLLQASVFAEVQERSHPFQQDCPAAPADPGGVASYADVIADESQRFPIRERPFRFVRRTRARRVRECCGLHLMALVFSLLDEAEREAGGPERFRPLRSGGTPTSWPEIAAEVRARLGIHRGRLDPASGRPFSLADVATAVEPEHDQRRREQLWRGLGLDRVLVAEVSTWAAYHLARCRRRPDGGTERASEDELRRLLALQRQLDARLFFHRAALEEVDWLRRHREVEVSVLASTRLRRILRLITRFKYLDRMYRIGQYQEPHVPGEPGLLDTEDPRVALRHRTVAEAQRLTGTRNWVGLPQIMQRMGSWNVYYYCACTIALAIRPAPDPTRSGRPTRIAEWKQRYDQLAELAVRALNHSLIVHRAAESSVVDSGALDWLLYEDPDLDALREHPRFRRWAAGTFGGDRVAQDESLCDRWLRAHPRTREWVNVGSFGMERRWTRYHRLSWLSSDHFLVASLQTMAPRVARRWRQRAAALGASDPAVRPGPVAMAELLATIRSDNGAWELVAAYRGFESRPGLRLTTARRMAELAGGAVAPIPFPTTTEVLGSAKVLDYGPLDVTLVGLVDEGLRDERRLAGLLAEPGSGGPAPAEFALRAARRWERLLDLIAGFESQALGRRAGPVDLRDRPAPSPSPAPSPAGGS